MKWLWYKGRTSRRGYFGISMLTIIVFLAMTFIGTWWLVFSLAKSFSGGTDLVTTIIWTLAGISAWTVVILSLVYILCMWISVMVIIRRLHDLNTSWLWAIVIVWLPFLWFFSWIYLQFFPWTRWPNKYDSPQIDAHTTDSNLAQTNIESAPLNNEINSVVINNEVGLSGKIDDPTTGRHWKEIWLAFAMIVVGMIMMQRQMYSLSQDVWKFISNNQNDTTKIDELLDTYKTNQEQIVILQDASKQNLVWLSGLQSTYDQNFSDQDLKTQELELLKTRIEALETQVSNLE